MDAIEDTVVRRTVVVPVSQERAFEFFAHRLIEWWPREFTFSEDALDSITMEPQDGGRWFETDTSGGQTDWGSVHEYRQPDRLQLSWKISPARTPEPDESRASDLRITFAPEGAHRTRVDLEHSRFDKHADGAEVMYTGMASAEGWAAILERYAERIIDNSEHTV